MKVSLALTRPAFPLPVAPVWSGGPWAFSPDASNPAVASDARQGGDRLRALPGTTLSASVDPPIREFNRTVQLRVARKPCDYADNFRPFPTPDQGICSKVGITRRSA